MKIPQALINSLQNVNGFNEKTFIEAHENLDSNISIRINPFKKTAFFDEDEPIAWSEFGKYLPKLNSDTLLPLQQTGALFLQEASSMYLEQVLKNTLDLSQDLKVLDLCAAPGGSSTLLASLLTPNSLLVCNDVIQTRSYNLSDNLTKWGTMNTVVTNNDPKDFMRLFGFFDVLIIDAPSSNSGLFRKDPNLTKEWSINNVDTWAVKQKKMINEAWSSLKQGGILIYSTSSYSKEENENIVDWIETTFSAEHLVAKENEKLEGIVISEGSFRLFPDKIKGEGFFITAFKKKSAEKEVFIRSGKPIKNNNRRTEREIFRNWIKDIDNHTWFEKNDEYFLISPTHEHSISLMQFNFNLKKVGTKIGKLSNKDLIPDHELALSMLLNNQINKVELDPSETIKYLKREEFTLKETAKGWSLMTFNGLGLGWAKILPNRINNYYPKDWRF